MTRVGSKPGKEFWLAALRHEGAAFRAAISPDGLGAAAPSQPGWTVERLMRRLGVVYQWVEDHITRGVTADPGPPVDDGPSGEPVIGWWDQRYDALLTVLDRIDPEAPAWNWAPQPKQAQFWHRRLAHQTALSRWDAQVAGGLPEPIEAKQALDGVAEVLDSWLPGGRRWRVDRPQAQTASPALATVGAGSMTMSPLSAGVAASVRADMGAAGLVQLVASDVEHEWLVRIRGAGVALLDTSAVLHEEHRIDAQAIGSASDLQLAMFGRVPFEVLQTAGPNRLLEAVRVG